MPLASQIAKYSATARGNHGKNIKLYRVESHGRRLAAGAIRASSQDDLAAHWQLFLATAAQGLCVANYRGVQLGMAMVTAARIPVPMEAN